MNWLPFMPGLILAVLAVWWGINRAAENRADARQVLRDIKAEKETREAMKNVETVSDPDLARVWLDDRPK